MRRHSTVIGVFDHARDAQDAICELGQLGFSDFELISPLNCSEAQTDSWPIQVTLGKITGVGPIVAAGPPATLVSRPSATPIGELIEALMALGVDHASFYAEELRRGRTLVTVHALYREDEAWMVLEYHCACRHDQTLVVA